MLDRFEDLRTFVAVVQARSLAGAGRRLGVVKSAVSRRLQELEDRLGTQLVNRSTRSLSLTATGQAFYERAVALLEDLEEAEGVAGTGATEPAGTLRVLAPATFGRMHLVPLVCAFLDAHPRMSIELSLSDDRVDLVGKGFDMAVRIGDLKDSGLVARRLTDVRRVACASPGYLHRFGTPGSLKDLARHRGIRYSVSDSQQFWRFQDKRTGEELSVPVSSRLTLDDGDALCAAAVAGFGITVLPTFIIHRRVAAGELVPLLLPIEKVPTGLHVVYPSRKRLPAKVRTFIDYLMERCGPTPYWDRDVFGG